MFDSCKRKSSTQKNSMPSHTDHRVKNKLLFANASNRRAKEMKNNLLLKDFVLQKHVIVSFVLTAILFGSLHADDPIFSGPQVGEKLASFKVRGFFEPNAG